MGLTEKLILPYIQDIEWNAWNSGYIFPFINLQMVFFEKCGIFRWKTSIS